ncbi:MAG: hypothetical protein KJ732_05850 [Candidatus Margulisbacteria bacterium]|nr:hypothetical protein [Candidatus Margulisiibacteriota bacterium]
MKNILITLCLAFCLFLVILTVGCEEVVQVPTTTTTTATTTTTNIVPFPSKSVVFQLSDLSSSSSSMIFAQSRNRNRELVVNAYAQAGIDLGYFDGFDPVLSTFRNQTLTTIASNEFTFVSTYGAGATGIPFKGHVEYQAANNKYLVQVWGIRPGESAYRRWLYGDFVSSLEGSIIIDPYVMWTSTHNYPMTIKFAYDATQTGTKICTGGATGKWSASSEVVGSSYFYCVEDNSDPSNTIVIFKMYQERTNEATGISILDKLYGKFNRDTKQLYGRGWNDGYPSDDFDSGYLYVNTETYATIETAVPADLNISSLAFPTTPEASSAAWPATSAFPATPTF